MRRRQRGVSVPRYDVVNAAPAFDRTGKGWDSSRHLSRLERELRLRWLAWSGDVRSTLPEDFGVLRPGQTWELLGKKPDDALTRKLKYESFAGTTVADIVVAGAIDPTVEG
ncbi:MAG: hypothetical protein AAFU85_31975 [Planctomycetota bacterium]